MNWTGFTDEQVTGKVNKLAISFTTNLHGPFTAWRWIRRYDTGCFEDDRPLLVYREWFSILVYMYLGVLLHLLRGLFSLHLGLLQLRLHLSQLGQHIGEEIFWVKSSFELLGQQCSSKTLPLLHSNTSLFRSTKVNTITTGYTVQEIGNGF